MAGLYFHIPFCKRVCAYCDFYKSADLRRMDDLLAAMHRELDDRRGYPGGEAVTTRYFGGGTPSLCTPEAIGGLLDHAAQLFDCSGAEETTLEANPDDLTAEYLGGLLEAGIDRLSIGVQSFDDDCLKLMNRRHTAAQAAEVVRAAQRAGFGNITVDLIFGMPGFGGETLRRSLDAALSLGVQHISAYHLTVEPDTAFGRRAARGEFRAVDEQISETEYTLVHQTLTGAGSRDTTRSRISPCPGFRARHNAAYWHGAKYLGIGPAAHSFDGRGAALERRLGGAEYIGGDAGGTRKLLTDQGPLQRVRDDGGCARPKASTLRGGRQGPFRHGARWQRVLRRGGPVSARAARSALAGGTAGGSRRARLLVLGRGDRGRFRKRNRTRATK